MKKFVVGLVFLASCRLLLAASVPSPAPAPSAGASATPAGPKPSVTAQMNQVIERINARLKARDGNTAGLAQDLKGFDDILAQHPGEKTDELAQVLLTKSMFFIQVIHDYGEGERLLKQVKTDFPDSLPATQVDETLAALKGPLEAQRTQAALQPGAMFPDFAVKDFLTGAPLSVAKYRGKPVLVQFWAPWNTTYLQELAGMRTVYQKFHPKGFEIIGVCLDDREVAVKDFLAKTGMTWPQYFDSKKFGNALAQKYAVTALPMSFLIDSTGKIVARDLRAAAVDALLTKMSAK